MKAYSLAFQERTKTWQAKVRKPDGSGWKTKWLPKQFNRSMEIDATAWLINWIQDWHQSFGMISPKNHSIKVGAKTIALLADRWLQLRTNDPSTKPNTLHGLKLSMKNWILDNEKFPHASIQHLDLETEFTVPVLRAWILSIGGSKSSKLAHIGALRSFFRQCIEEEWINPEMQNPMDKPAIRKMVKDIATNHRIKKEVSFLTASQTMTLLTGKVDEYRLMRYWMALGTGMRDHEIQALTWNDVVLDDEIPYVNVKSQLDIIGHGPCQSYESLTDQGWSKDKIKSSKQAVSSLPKYGSVRLIPLVPALVQRLKAWQAQGWRKYVGRKPTSSDPIFARSNISLRAGACAGDFCFSESANLFRKDLERNGLPTESNGLPLVFHSLRHTTASLMANAGVQDATIGEILGHSAKSVTRGSYVARQLKAPYEALLTLPFARISATA